MHHFAVLLRRRRDRPLPRQQGGKYRHEADEPRRFATRFGSWILRGRSSATFEPEGDETRVTQEFETVGRISAISSWLFSRGSYEGSFRGELEKFGRIAEREAQE
jgi:hypothetical protein